MAAGPSKRQLARAIARVEFKTGRYARVLRASNGEVAIMPSDTPLPRYRISVDDATVAIITSRWSVSRLAAQVRRDYPSATHWEVSRERLDGPAVQAQDGAR